MTKVNFSFGALEQTLAVGFRIAPDDFPKFRARIKQLQRLGFPEGVNIGRGAKMPYSTEHLFKLAVAFALLDTGLTAKLVTEFVEREWEKFAAAFWAARGTPVNSSDVFGHIRFNALSTTSGDDAELTIEDEFSSENAAAAIRNGFYGSSFVVINLTALLRRILFSADQAAQLSKMFLEMEIREWRTERPVFEPFGPQNTWFRVGHFNSEGAIFDEDPEA